jgi:hypothetical protein
MGWSVPDEPITESTDLEWYKEAASRHYTDYSWHSVWTFAEAAVGDLVWFRNTEGRFYLCELLAPWRYSYKDEASIDADIINFRKVRIIEVGLADAVPGKIIACFRPARTFQPIRSPGMLAFSAQLAGLQQNDGTALDLYELMTDRDLENLVFVYLQVKGWYVLPGTHAIDTAHYEFVLVNRETGERAITQVKSGGTPIDASRYSGQERAFLFAASENYGINIPPNAVLIKRRELNGFMRQMPHLLPRAVSTWIDMAGLPSE